MKKTIFLSALFALGAFCFLSCGAKNKSAAKASDTAFESVAAMEEADSIAMASGGKGNFSNAKSSSQKRAATKESPAGEPHTYERKLIRTGDVSIQVQSLSDTRAATESWVKSFDGYISNSSENSRSLSITVRIPSEHFDQAMSHASGMGKIESKTVKSNDVTDEFYDLQGRIKTKQILLERYQNYLRQATKIDDILSVEASINEVTAELESMQGRMNRLASQVDFSTIHISAVLPPKKTEEGFALPNTKSQFIALVGNIAGFFNGLLFFVLYAVIFGVPIVLLAAGFWWLCFGKLGLVRRLFALISKKRN